VVADVHLHELAAVPAPQEPRATPWYDEQTIGGDRAQRRQVEVIAVGVGDEDDVGRERACARRAAVATDVRDPVSKDRICQQANATDLDEDGGVPYIGERRAAQAARMRAF
jgi:hypothetical protein